MMGRQVGGICRLAFKYDPSPPFHAGSPEMTGAMLADHVRERWAALRAIVTQSRKDKP